MATESQTTYNTVLSIAGVLPRVRGGQRVTISNRIVSRLSFVLSKFGSPTGDVTFEIRKVSDDSLIMSKVWGSAADLQASGSEQWESVTFDTSTLINEEVRLICYYPDNVSNYRVEQHYQNTDVKSSEYQTFYGASWTASPTADCAYRYDYGGSYAGGVVTTQAVSDIDKTTATGNGTVINRGEPPATQHGIVWGRTPDNFVERDALAGYYGKTEEGVPSATGAFTGSLTGLFQNTLYYARAYITNSVMTVYGQEVTFTTLSDVPVVATQLATFVLAATALGNGFIRNDGGSPITERGFVWDETTDPTVTDGGSGFWGKVTNETGEDLTRLGLYSLLMTALTENKTYHYRAYVINSDGTAYGDDVTFITSNLGVPHVQTLAAINIEATSCTGRGKITDIGGSDVTEHGHCWSTSPNPTTSDSKTTLGAGTLDEVFTSPIAGLPLDTTIYMRAYATNDQGTDYGDNFIILKGWGYWDDSEVGTGGEELLQIAIQNEDIVYVSKTGLQRKLRGVPF